MSNNTPKEKKLANRSSKITLKRALFGKARTSSKLDENASIQLIYRQTDSQGVESDTTSRIASTCNHLNGEDPKLKDFVPGQGWATDEKSSTSSRRQSAKALVDPKKGNTDIVQDMDTDGDDIL